MKIKGDVSAVQWLAAWVEGRWLLSAPKWQHEAQEEVKAERYSAHSCCWLALSAGMLPLGHACRHKSLVLPFQQLHEYSCYSMHGSSCSCIPLGQNHLKASAICAVSVTILPAAASVRHSVSKTFSTAIQFFPSTLLRTWIFCFLSSGKGSKHKPHMVQTQAELWKNPTILWVGELKREGKKKWIWLERAQEAERAILSITQHTHTLERHLLRFKSKSLLP